jgi:hypothetical protein
MNSKINDANRVKEIYAMTRFRGQCILFYQAEEKMREGHLTPPHFQKELVQDKEWGPKIIESMRNTRLGFGKDLKWKVNLEAGIVKGDLLEAIENPIESGDFGVGGLCLCTLLLQLTIIFILCFVCVFDLA